MLVGKIFNGVVCHLCVANCCSMFGTAFNIKTMESIVFNEVVICVVYVDCVVNGCCAVGHVGG